MPQQIPRRQTTNKYNPDTKKMEHDPENYRQSPWSDHWRNDMIDFGTEGHHVIKAINDEKPEYLKHRIWGLGDPTLMEKPFIVAFTGRNWKCPKDEMEIGKQIIIRMSEMGLMPIHGNDRGTERVSARLLREQHGKQIIVPHYGLLQFKNKYGHKMSYAVENSHVLVLSPFTVFEPWRPRNSEKRNIFIAEMADAMIGVQITDENSGGDLARKLLARDKPVFLTDPEGRADYCVKDHQFFVDKGAKLFKMNQLDAIIRSIKEQIGYKEPN